MEAKWINVKKKLPEIGQDVFVYHNIGSVTSVTIGFINSITELESTTIVEWLDGEYQPRDTTHWMYLPKPPTT